MLAFRYNRQTNTKIYYFGVITIPEIFILLIAMMLSIALFKSAVLMTLYMFLHLAYLAAFRAGKPAGYDEHFFSALFTPKIMRPGKLSPLYPIKTK